MSTVRDASLAVIRECALDPVFANPGSTELPFLGDLPLDIHFVLGLHEASVVGMATGYAIATGRPALVLLHTTAGFGNAVGALATARVNRAPLVVLVGQQDRRHLAQEPFLAGHLDGLGGAYPVWSCQPVQAHDVPGAIRHAWHESSARRGPAIVVVPMDDWSVPFEPDVGVGVPPTVRRAGADPGEAIDDVVAILERAASPAIVAGAGADNPPSWSALVELAERLGAPVWQEAFGARAGFPQDHPRFAGHLPAHRSALRETLGQHDSILVVGASAFRQYVYEPGPLLPRAVSVVVVSDDPDELYRSCADLAVLGPPGPVCRELARRLTPRPGRPGPARPGLRPPLDDGVMRAEHVFAALAARLPPDAVVVEETPSSRPALHQWLPAQMPGGFLSAAMGGLGFGLPAAAGLRLGDPSRPVIAVLGDGSSMYAIQGLWSAAHYGCGVLYIVLSNGRYAIMDQLASRAGVTAPWPPFDALDVAGMARAMGCDAQHVDTHADLLATLDGVIPTLAARRTPLLLDIAVSVSP